MRKRITITRLLAAMALSCVLLVNCGAQGVAPEQAEQGQISGTTVGPVAAEVELEPVSDSGVYGTLALRKVGDLGVQVELGVSGLPKHGMSYYAQIHQGECSEVREGAGEHEHQHNAGHKHGYSEGGLTLALIRLDRLLAKVSKEEYAHGGHDHDAPAADELPGNIDQPVEFLGSPEGAAFVTTLLDGVTLKEVFSGKSKYLDVHAAGSEDSPILACVDLDEGH